MTRVQILSAKSSDDYGQVPAWYSCELIHGAEHPITIPFEGALVLRIFPPNIRQFLRWTDIGEPQPRENQGGTIIWGILQSLENMCRAERRGSAPFT